MSRKPPIGSGGVVQSPPVAHNPKARRMSSIRRALGGGSKSERQLGTLGGGGRGGGGRAGVGGLLGSGRNLLRGLRASSRRDVASSERGGRSAPGRSNRLGSRRDLYIENSDEDVSVSHLDPVTFQATLTQQMGLLESAQIAADPEAEAKAADDAGTPASAAGAAAAAAAAVRVQISAGDALSLELQRSHIVLSRQDAAASTEGAADADPDPDADADGGTGAGSGGTRVLLRRPYSDVVSILWDHHQSSVRITLPQTDYIPAGEYSVRIPEDEPLSFEGCRTHAKSVARGKAMAVNTLVPGGALDRGQSGYGAEGNLLKSIGGQPTKNMSFETCLHTLKYAPRPLLLVFEEVDAREEAEAESEMITITLEFEASSEVEEELAAKMLACNATQASVEMVGIFSNLERPKPFNRKPGQLARAADGADGAKPGNARLRETALRLHALTSSWNIEDDRAEMAQLRRDDKKRVRIRAMSHSSHSPMSLAVQHIHKGHVIFPGRTGGSPCALIIDFAHVAIHSAKNGKPVGPPLTEFSWRNVVSWETSRDSIVLYGLKDEEDDVQVFRVAQGVAQHQQTDGNAATQMLRIHIELTLGEPLIVSDCLEFFLNRFLVSKGHTTVEGTIHGRSVQMIDTVHGLVPISSASSNDLSTMLIRSVGRRCKRTTLQRANSAPRAAVLLRGVSSKFGGSQSGDDGGVSAKVWRSTIKHVGWLLARRGWRAQWRRVYCAMFSTVTGHWLMIYDNPRDLPLYTSLSKPKQAICIAAVRAIRARSLRADLPGVPPFAFDLVTIDSEVTLCGESGIEKQHWLQTLARAVEEDAAIVPAEEHEYSVQLTTGQPRSTASEVLRVDPFGVSHVSFEPYTRRTIREQYWSFTDIFCFSSTVVGDTQVLRLIPCRPTEDTTEINGESLDFVMDDVLGCSSLMEFMLEKFMIHVPIRCYQQLMADETAAEDGPAAADDTEIDADGGGFDDEMAHPAIISENTPVSVARLLQAEAPPPPADVVLGQGEPVANPVAGALSQST